MPDQDDQSGILAILANGSFRDQLANRELVDSRRDAGIFDLFRQMIHPAREDWTERATEQVGAHVWYRRRLGSGRRWCCSHARRRNRACRRRIEAQEEEAGGKHCPSNDRCNLGRLDHALLLVPRRPGR
jgi:hypothetical protein